LHFKNPDISKSTLNGEIYALNIAILSFKSPFVVESLIFLFSPSKVWHSTTQSPRPNIEAGDASKAAAVAIWPVPCFLPPVVSTTSNIHTIDHQMDTSFFYILMLLVILLLLLTIILILYSRPLSSIPLQFEYLFFPLYYYSLNIKVTHKNVESIMDGNIFFVHAFIFFAHS